MTPAGPLPGPVATLGERGLSLEEFEAVCRGREVVLAGPGRWAMEEGTRRLEVVLGEGTPVYGVTTGYGESSDREIPPGERAAFQLATLRSHACGTGNPLPWAVARGTWLAKAASLATGRTGAGVALVDQLVGLLNAGLAPVIPATGSLGASGDLIPAGHAGLPLVGEEEVMDPEGRVLPAGEALAGLGLPPVGLGPRDGLSLVNGTSVTVALGATACLAARRYLDRVALVAAAGLEAVGGHPEAWADAVLSARPHPGAVRAAAGLRAGLEGWNRTSTPGPPHDPYAWRCAPQVHGAAQEALDWAASATGVELGSCTDNPVLDPSGSVVSGGNFHAAPLGLAYDALALGLREVGALSRQRIVHLDRRLDGGPGPGLVMVLTGATAALLEAAGLGPATGRWLPVDAVEDHVSNATTAARYLATTLDLLWRALAGEALAATAILQRSGGPGRSRAGRELQALVDGIVEGPLRLDRPLSATLTGLAAGLASG